ncbi:hypothetical protein HHI36_021574 [Cryptolaemus montrouzieri]|uniref:TGF-beta propeptide domain-containing protein n=1 Tax=Cryptolaemus montrouzieri TaxID=559131 RepID=A0ABD2MXJ6_9CUCU
MMAVSVKMVVLILTVSSVFLNKFSLSAPYENLTRTSNVDLEIALYNFLDIYYEKYIKNTKYEQDLLKKNGIEEREDKKVDIYDTMQGDQPVDEGNNVNVLPPTTNYTGNFSDVNILQASRNRGTIGDDENRTKDNWIQMLKINILQQVGRANATIAIPGESRLPPLNLTQLFPNTPNETNPLEDLISKKIRTFYPSCSIPEAAEQEFRNDDKLMNLFFNYTEDDQTSKIATATLRMHRIPLENSSLANPRPKNCTTVSNDEEKLLRVSIYWYLKPQRNKRRGKKRLCDSRVISENARWVELNVANAIKSWNKEQNLGLAIQVEDQDGRTLKAEKYFKGPTCLVGMSTPRPIPSILMDNAGNPEQLSRLLGRNTTTPISSNLPLFPTIDVCILGFPVNYSNIDISSMRTNACNLKLLHEQAQKLLEKDKLERLASLTSKLRPST